MKLTKIIPSIQNPQFSATRTSLSLYHLHAGSVLQFTNFNYLLKKVFADDIAPIEQNKSEPGFPTCSKFWLIEIGFQWECESCSTYCNTLLWGPTHWTFLFNLLSNNHICSIFVFCYLELQCVYFLETWHGNQPQMLQIV